MDGDATYATAPEAGYLRIYGQIVNTITIASGASLDIDVEGTKGVVFGLNNMNNVSITRAATALTLSVSTDVNAGGILDGVPDDWGTAEGITELGVFGLNMASVNINLPDAIIISPH